MIKIKIYFQKVCPKCESYEFIKIYTGTDGLFTYKTFSHYKCEKCNHEFNNFKIISTINKYKYDYVKSEVKKSFNNLLLKYKNNKFIKEEMKRLGL